MQFQNTSVIKCSFCMDSAQCCMLMPLSLCIPGLFINYLIDSKPTTLQ